MDHLMKNIFVVLIISSLFSCKYRSNDREAFYVSDSIRPGIVFKDEELELGNLRLNKPCVVEFKYLNHTNESIVVSNVQTTCGCTIADWDKRPLPPNESSVLKVMYSADHVGFFRKEVTVHSNAANSPVKLIIKGEVVY